MFLFARRRRRRQEEEYNAGHPGGGGAGHSHSIPPLAPVGPIGDLDQVVVENKHLPPAGGPNGDNGYPGGPSGDGVVPGGPNGDGSYPGGPNNGSSVPGEPTGSANGVPPVGHGSDHSNLGKIATGVAAVGLIGAAAGSREKKDDREEVSHGHVAPVPVPVPAPGGPSDKTEVDEETSAGRGGVAPVPVPGGPTSDNPTDRPSGPGGAFPVGGSTSTTTETTETETTETSGNKGGLFAGVLGGAAAAAGYMLGRKRSDSTGSDSKKTITTKTTVTTSKNGGRIYTTTGTGGRTVITERTETGSARHILTGVAPGSTTVRTITQRTETGEEILIPVDHPEGEEREIITDRDENGKTRYIIGGLIAGAIGAGVVRHVVSSRTESESGETSRIIPAGSSTVTSSTRIVTERTTSGEVRHVIVGGFSGNAVRIITERTSSGETRLIPTNEPTGELHHVISERSESGDIRYIIGGIIAGAAIGSVVERTESGGTRFIPGGIFTVTSTTRIVTERTLNGEIRYIIVGGFSGSAIRVITERTSTGELRMIPTNDESAEVRQVISERSESGEIRYIIGSIISTTRTNIITRMVMGPRIITERTSTGETRYVIVDQYNGNAIRTKFERSEETGEFVHIPVKEPEGELRYVTEERTETGEIRKVIGAVISGKVTTTTRTVSGGLIPEGTSTSQTRIVAERTESGDVTYYQITNGPDGQEIRTVVERTEDGGFRIPGGAMIVGAGATLVGNNHQTTTTTRVVGGGVLTPAEQAANKTQITLKLSIMRYERADASAAIPSATIGTVMFSKFKMIAAGDVNIDDTAYSHVEEVKTGARRTIKWMKTEVHWKREAGMLQHLKSDRYIADLFTLYSLPTFAEYRFVSILGSFSRTLESYMQTQQLSSIQIRQLTVSLADALRWCHEHHVVHLNVRPASFYLEGVAGQESNEPLVWKLWNFGHARFVGETVDTAVTTVSYAAPEILNGRKKSDANVLSAVTMDRWSLGLILYELHTRKAYFTSGASAEYQLTNEDGTQFEPALEAVKEDDARQAIRGLLEVDVEKRYTYETLTQVYTGKA
ncbi:unnamed protein product [Mortierella alpina]